MNATLGIAMTQVLSNPVARVPGLLQSIFHNTPSLLKWVLGLLFLINVRSWPFVWHCECGLHYVLDVFILTVAVLHSDKVLVTPVYEIRLRYWAFLLKNLVYSRKKRLELKDKWLQGLCPVGEDPIKFTVTVKGWAGKCPLHLVTTRIPPLQQHPTPFEWSPPTSASRTP